ncbi:MAG: sialate O-acetylesterase [Pseudomonas sp.]
MASLGVSIDANSSVYATYTDGQRTVSTPGWALPADASNYDSAFTGEFLRREIAASGVNCALVGHSVGATTISTWVPGGANNAQLRVILDAVAGFEAFIWFQGHSDSLAGTSQATYSTSLDALFADVTSRNTVKGASYDKILCPIPNISSSSWGTQAQIDTIRQAQAQWAVSNQAFYSIPMDIDLIDGVHESMLGAVRLGLRFSAAFQRTTVAATSLTPTSVTYATGKTGFGQERTGGYGTLAASFEAINGQTWTFEAVISVASAPASVKVAMGQTNKGWIGVAPDGRLIGNYYNSSSADSFINGTTTAGGGTNPIITDGVRRHVAIVSNPSGAKLFVDGVQVGTSATAPRGQAGNAGFGVGTFNFNPATYAWTGTVDEAAIFATDRYSGAFSPPSAPYSGTETALLSVWHLDGDVTAAMAP